MASHAESSEPDLDERLARARGSIERDAAEIDSRAGEPASRSAADQSSASSVGPKAREAVEAVSSIRDRLGDLDGTIDRKVAESAERIERRVDDFAASRVGAAEQRLQLQSQALEAMLSGGMAGSGADMERISEEQARAEQRMRMELNAQLENRLGALRSELLGELRRVEESGARGGAFEERFAEAERLLAERFSADREVLEERVDMAATEMAPRIDTAVAQAAAHLESELSTRSEHLSRVLGEQLSAGTATTLGQLREQLGAEMDGRLGIARESLEVALAEAIRRLKEILSDVDRSVRASSGALEQRSVELTASLEEVVEGARSELAAAREDLERAIGVTTVSQMRAGLTEIRSQIDARLESFEERLGQHPEGRPAGLAEEELRERVDELRSELDATITARLQEGAASGGPSAEDLAAAEQRVLKQVERTSLQREELIAGETRRRINELGTEIGDRLDSRIDTRLAEARDHLAALAADARARHSSELQESLREAIDAVDRKVQERADAAFAGADAEASSVEERLVVAREEIEARRGELAAQMQREACEQVDRLREELTAASTEAAAAAAETAAGRQGDRVARELTESIRGELESARGRLAEDTEAARARLAEAERAQEREERIRARVRTAEAEAAERVREAERRLVEVMARLEQADSGSSTG